MQAKDIGRYLRVRGVVENPRDFVAAQRPSSSAEPVQVRLRRWGPVSIRAGTADVRILKEIFVRDVYDLARFEDPKHTGSKGLDCVVDIGGHIGLFAIRASGVARRVVSFEPMPSNIELFLKNTQSAGARNVELSQSAVSADEGAIVVFASSNPGGHSIYPALAGSAEKGHSAPGLSLAGAFEKHAVQTCDFLKVDCEGGEYPILYGADASTLSRIRRLALEYHAAESVNPRYTGEDLERFLVARGFETQRFPSRRRKNHGLIRAERAG